jgi:lactoylglutathione lyase
MRFALATLYVKNMKKSLVFYNAILEIPVIRRQPIGPDKELVFLGVEGEANLELIPTDENMSYSGFSIGFDVDNLPAMKERLAANGYVVKREFSPDPSTVLCFLNGPDGEEVELIARK